MPQTNAASTPADTAPQCHPEPFCRFMELHGDPELPVLPGMLLGIATDLAPFTAGADSDSATPAPPFYTVDLATREIRATALGKMSMNGNKMEIIPLVSVSKNALTVRTTVYATDFIGGAIPPIVYDRATRQLKVTLPVDLKSLAQTIAAVRESGTPQEAVLCTGKPPRHGANGRLERLLKERDSVGAQKDSGTIDYRDRGAHPHVEEGTPVARYHPATKGVRGMDVFGNEIPARDGSDRPVRTGDNIREVPQEDGTTLYEATALGLVDVRGGSVGVSTVLHIKGDVDMTTGNIVVETGSVHVTGTIRSGFSVTVADHLIVNGLIESALVTCGGDVSVRGGIAMEGRNLIRARGNITAAFAQDAVLEAEGDVIINGGIINSFITCKGSVLAQRGKGLVMGGSIVASRGIDVLESGSELGAQTALTIALDLPELDALLREMDSSRSKLQRLDQWLGKGTPRTILLQTPEPDRRIVAEMIRVRARLEERVAEIQREVTRIKNLNNHALARTPVIIRKKAHQGTRIKIGDRAMSLHHPETAVRYQWNPEDRQITTHSLI